KLGGTVVGIGFLVELVDLKGRDLIREYPIKVLTQY
ncbi:MAG TPA: adenine phosphoribosyltransferase, partial [Acholeplasmataceae bacterium]|nr:adenine phosphoribosyltransferase [Acholeplasmataceae bacterium]